MFPLMKLRKNKEILKNSVEKNRLTERAILASAVESKSPSLPKFPLEVAVQ